MARWLVGVTRALVGAASRLVPREERDRWTREWEAELAHRSSRGALDVPSALRLLGRSCGAVPHALWHLREAWRWDALSQDFRHACRTVLLRPGFVVAASVTLGVGIGATTGLFSVVDAVLLRPLPYPEPDRLVYLFETNGEAGGGRTDPAPGNVLDWRRESRTLEAVAAWWVDSATLLADSGNEAEEVPAARVTVDFFPALGVEPALGRVFTPAEIATAERVVVLSHELWRRRFGGDETVVGRDVRSRDGAHRIVGVMPPSFRTPGSLPGEVQLFIPWDLEREYARLPRVPRDWRFLRTAARLGPGVALAEAAEELDAIAASLADRYPDTNRGWGVALAPLRDVMVGSVEPVLVVLAGAVSFVLLLACANVAGLLLVRAAGRSHEMAVRTALGATRGRLAQKLLLESFLLGGLGGLLGLLIAGSGVELLRRFPPGGVFRIEETAVDGRVLLFAIAASALAGIASGLVPAFQGATRSPSSSLKAGTLASSDRRRQRLRTAIVVTEVAVSVVLLAGASLFLRSFSRLAAVETGFVPDGVLVARMRLDAEKYGRGGAHLYYTELLSRLRALPGVEAAGGVTALPMDSVDVDFDRPFWRDGEPRPEGGGAGVRVRMPTVGYFHTMRIPLLGGRLFDERDDRSKPRVLIVSETMARRTWTGESPVGKRLRLDYQDYEAPYEVVGVVGDTRFEGHRSEPAPEVYIPHAQNAYLPLNLVIRSSSPEAIAPAVRATILAMDETQPVHSIDALATLTRAHVGRERFIAFVMTIFGAMALLLATIGLYGVVAQSASQRRGELGLRMALGADRKRILGLVLKGGLEMGLWGSALGLCGAIVAGRFLGAILYQISPADPASLAVATAGSMGTVLLASYLPARRAARVDPTTTLRRE